MVFLAQSSPVRSARDSLHPRGGSRGGGAAAARAPLPYGHRHMPTFASQMVRRLKAYRVLDVEQLMRELAEAAP